MPLVDKQQAIVEGQANGESCPAEKALDVDRLELLLSDPGEAVVSLMGRLSGDILFLGAGGKIGPSIAQMAKRASDQANTPRRIFAASRFSNSDTESRLKTCGVETIRTDLFDRQQLGELPEVKNVIYLAGYKFGTVAAPSLSWASNSYLPGLVMERFQKSRVVAYSTGSVYGLSEVTRAGSVETDPLLPTDEYSMSCVGRERIIEHFSRTNGTEAALLRLNYAVELRYGVLVDIAKMVLAGQPIDVTMGHLNVIWQGDANAMALCSLEKVSSPPFVLNIAGPEQLSVRSLAETFGEIMKKPVQFEGTESSTCLLSNGGRCQELFGYPRVTVQKLIEWTADWVMQARKTHGKPTGFQIRDGSY
jgi:nucleoside-diphosphate-sugar epimerase